MTGLRPHSSRLCSRPQGPRPAAASFVGGPCPSGSERHRQGPAPPAPGQGRTRVYSGRQQWPDPARGPGLCLTDRPGCKVPAPQPGSAPQVGAPTLQAEWLTDASLAGLGGDFPRPGPGRAGCPLLTRPGPTRSREGPSPLRAACRPPRGHDRLHLRSPVGPAAAGLRPSERRARPGLWAVLRSPRSPALAEESPGSLGDGGIRGR